MQFEKPLELTQSYPVPAIFSTGCDRLISWGGRRSGVEGGTSDFERRRLRVAGFCAFLGHGRRGARVR